MTHQIQASEFITIRLATSYFDRLKGLLFTASDDLGRDALVLTPCSAVHTLLMRYPIDLAFLGKHGVVLRVLHGAAPGRGRIACAGAVAVMERPSTHIGRWPCMGEQVALSATRAKISLGYDTQGEDRER